MTDAVPNYLAAPTASTQTTTGSLGSLDLLSNLLGIHADNPGTGIGTGNNVGGDGGDGINLAGVGAGLQGLAGLASAWAGLQGVKLGKKQLAFQKDFSEKQMAHQESLIDTELAQKQQRLIAASPGQYQSVNKYMNEHGVSQRNRSTG